MKAMKNINDIGCQWRFAENSDYIELDIHQSNFHCGITKSTSPKYAKIMTRNNGTRYIRHNGEMWDID